MNQQITISRLVKIEQEGSIESIIINAFLRGDNSSSEKIESMKRVIDYERSRNQGMIESLDKWEKLEQDYLSTNGVSYYNFRNHVASLLNCSIDEIERVIIELKAIASYSESRAKEIKELQAANNFLTEANKNLDKKIQEWAQVIKDKKNKARRKKVTPIAGFLGKRA